MKIKKENYLNDSEYMKYLEQVFTPGQLKNELDLDRAGLLVIDMQDFFLSEKSHAYVPDSKIILERIKSLIDRFKAKDLTVFQTRHLNTSADAYNMSKWWDGIIQKDDWNSNISSELQDESIPVIVKSQYDSFYNTDFENLLREKGIEQIIICGLMTHLCCETTARSAFVRGFKVFFLYDMTASYNREFHNSTLMNLSHGFADMINFDWIMQLVGSP
jgi:isochorismate hydrolase